MRQLFAFFVAVFALSAHAADYAREKRWAEEITPSILVGEAIELTAKNRKFLAILTPAEKTRAGVIVVHGLGVHPDWNMIGVNQWVEARKVAVVTPNTTPPEGVTTGRWIDVNLAEQTLAVYDKYQLVFATVIASGLEPYWTRPGLFQIYQKKEIETMRNNDPTDFYYLDNVPWTMYFDKARALHGAYWRTRFGYPQSHGCVNLSVGDAHWLFIWAQEGDWVYVHDPSGLTPTDPALYPDWAY